MTDDLETQYIGRRKSEGQMMIKPYYEEPGITIYCADCRDVLPQLETVDLVLTDPPYGIERFNKGSLRFDKKGEFPYGIKWNIKPEKDFINEIINKGKHSIVWGANNFEVPTSEYFLVWDKEQTVDNFASAELAFTNLKIPAKVFRFSIHKHNQIKKVHPTEKPIELMRWCLSLSIDSQTILDPFMGSGTTLRAAKDLGRKAIGIEIEQKYCDIAIERLRQGVLI